MPENDQTRWIGIRPTNPAETIPVSMAAPPPCAKVEPCAANTPFNTLTRKIAPAISDRQAIQTCIIATNTVASVAGNTYVPVYTVPAGKILVLEKVVAYPVMVNNSGVIVFIQDGVTYYWIDGSVGSVLGNTDFFPQAMTVDEGLTVGGWFIVSVVGRDFTVWVYGYLISKYV